ncbi:MAG: hypothetical protein HYY00_04370 [Chloroflexi bacterium]|nr:hypothetical protein [Chloroflexota bacterium]
MTNVRKWQGVIRQLKVLLETLPSPEERDDTVRGIRGLVDVLDELGRSLGNLPSSTEAAKAKDALESLENILGRNPLLRVGPAKTKETSALKTPRRRIKPSEVSIPKDNILREIDTLSQLTEDTLRTRLQQQNHYSRDLLRSILGELGRRTPSKLTRNELVEQIVVTIINRQTYAGLRGSQSGHL